MRKGKSPYKSSFEDKTDLIFVCVIVTVGILLFGYIFLSPFVYQFTPLGHWYCGLDWDDSGFEYRYKLGSGCQVNTPANGWIPESKFRAVD